LPQSRDQSEDLRSLSGSSKDILTELVEFYSKIKLCCIFINTLAKGYIQMPQTYWNTS